MVERYRHHRVGPYEGGLGEGVCVVFSGES